MDVLFFLLSISLFILSVVAFFKPSIVKQTERKKAFNYPFLTALASFVIFIFLIKPTSENTTGQTASTQNIAEKREIKEEEGISKKPTLSVDKTVKNFLENRSDYREIEVEFVKDKHTKYSDNINLYMGKLATTSDNSNVLEDELNRGLFYGAFWSFYSVGSQFKSGVSEIEVIIFIKNIETKKVFKTKKLTFEQRDFKNAFKEKIEKLAKKDEHGFLQMNDQVSSIYNAPEKLKDFISNIEEGNNMMQEHLNRQIAEQFGADYDAMQNHFQKNMQILKEKHNE